MRPGARTWPGRLLLAAAAAAALGLWIWSAGAPVREVRELAPAQRRALAERTLANVREVCAPHEPRPRDLCRDQATLLLELPECDAECAATARNELLLDGARK